MHLIGLRLEVIHNQVAVIVPGLDTEFLDKHRVGIHPATHEVNYGTGAIEGMHAVDGHILFLPEHFNRLVGSANAIGILDGRWQPDEDQFRDALIELHACNADELETDPETGLPFPMYFRPLLFEASAELGVGSTANWTMAIMTRTKTSYLGAQSRTGVTIWAPGPMHFRRPDATCGLAAHKVAASYALGHKWKKRAAKCGAVEVLQFNLQNNLAETTGSNIFVVKQGIVFTPELDGSVLPGINRKRVIDLLKAAEYTVIECQLTPEMFAEADEVFLTGTWAGVVPVRHVLYGWPGVEPWFDPPQCVGPVTALAMDLHDLLLRRQLNPGHPRLGGRFTIDPAWYTPVG